MNKEENSVLEELGIDESFMNYYLYFLVKGTIDSGIDFVKLSDVAIVYVKCVMRFWGKHPNLKNAISEEQHIMINFLSKYNYDVILLDYSDLEDVDRIIYKQVVDEAFLKYYEIYRVDKINDKP